MSKKYDPPVQLEAAKKALGKPGGRDRGDARVPSTASLEMTCRLVDVPRAAPPAPQAPPLARSGTSPTGDERARHPPHLPTSATALNAALGRDAPPLILRHRRPRGAIHIVHGGRKSIRPRPAIPAQKRHPPHETRRSSRKHALLEKVDPRADTRSRIVGNGPTKLNGDKRRPGRGAARPSRR